jgi:hypothetical protein
MDPEASRFSTADYSFHQDPPDSNEYIFDNDSSIFNEEYSYYYPSTIDFIDTDYDTALSLYTYIGDRAGGSNLFWNEPHSTLEVEFDEGVSPPCEDLLIYFAL